MKRLLMTLLSGMACLCSFAQFSGAGSGTQADPYKIYNADQLDQVRNFLNNTNVYFKLMSNINIGEWLDDNGIRDDGWTPVGISSQPFKGHFDGNSKTVSNLVINSSSDYAGIFGYVSGATIENLKVNGAAKGNGYLGGLIGRADSSIVRNCTFTATGDIAGTGNYIGGLIGFVNGSAVSDCTFSTKYEVKGSQYVGGLAGYAEGEISGSSASGNVTANGDNCGGLVGSANNLLLTGNIAVGNVSGQNYTGGIVGYLTSSKSVSDCNHNGNVNGRSGVGGVIGMIANSNIPFIEKCSSIGSVNGTENVGGVVGMFFTLGQTLTFTKTYENCTYSTDRYAYPVDGNGTRIDMYYDRTLSEKIVYKHSGKSGIFNCFVIGDITSQGDYAGGIIGQECNGIAYSKDKYAYYRDASLTEPFPFKIRGESGSFYIRAYTGSYIYVTIADNFFSGEISGKDYVGGIVGSKKRGELLRNLSNATVKGNSNVGGIVGAGYFDGEALTIQSNVAVNESVSGNSHVGCIYGLLNGNNVVGANGGNKENRALSSTKLSIGGVIQNVENDLQNGRAAGASTLKLIANYVTIGWDFNNDWTILETESYPFKAWQPAPPTITSKLTSGATTISGKSTAGGEVHLMIGDSFSDTVAANNNVWSMTVPALQSGETVKCYVTSGNTQSPYYITSVSFPGSGTVDDPYLVYTASDLQGVFRKGYYKLMNDIDLGAWIADKSPEAGWLPVGMNGSDAIYFDGDNHRISGLWFNSSTDYNGLFSNIPGGYIKNLTVEAADGKTLTGANQTAVLAGRLQNASVQNVVVKGNVTGGEYVGGITASSSAAEFTSVAFEGNVTGSNYVGGITASSDATEFSSVTVKGEVTSTESNGYAGSISGKTVGGKVTGVSANATVCTTGVNSNAGGLCGYSSAKISQCTFAGLVRSSGESSNTGGLVGQQTSDGSLTDSYSTADVNGTLYTAGAVALNYGDVSHVYASGNVSGVFYGGGVVAINEGSSAVVKDCLAANPTLSLSDQSAWANRVIGNYRNGAPDPGENDNIALKTMQVSINNVTKKVYDDPLHGISKTAAELSQADTYTSMGWNFSTVWRLSSEVEYPVLLRIENMDITIGDVNADKEIDVADVIEIARYVAGNPSLDFLVPAADVDADGEINIADAVALVNIIAGDVISAKPRKSASEANITLSARLMSQGNRFTLDVEDVNRFTACEFTLYSSSEPDEIRLLASSGNTHQTIYNRISEDTYRVVVMSIGNILFDGTDNLMELDMANSDAYVKISDMLFVTPDGVRATLDMLEPSSVVTGIDGISPEDAESDDEWFNLQGVKTQNIVPGIYIHNGKKVIIK